MVVPQYHLPPSCVFAAEMRRVYSCTFDDAEGKAIFEHCPDGTCWLSFTTNDYPGLILTKDGASAYRLQVACLFADDGDRRLTVYRSWFQLSTLSDRVVFRKKSDKELDISMACDLFWKVLERIVKRFHVDHL